MNIHAHTHTSICTFQEIVSSPISFLLLFLDIKMHLALLFAFLLHLHLSGFLKGAITAGVIKISKSYSVYFSNFATQSLVSLGFIVHVI